MNLDRLAADRLVGHVATYVRQARPPAMDAQVLSACLRLLLKWRSQALSDRLVALHGRRVLHGPFAGMDYTSEASEGGLAPRLLGTYEAELHPALAAVAARGLQLIYDVGCAEGYYAVGLARAVPGARVRAYGVAEARTEPWAPRASSARTAAWRRWTPRRRWSWRRATPWWCRPRVAEGSARPDPPSVDPGEGGTCETVRSGSLGLARPRTILERVPPGSRPPPG